MMQVSEERGELAGARLLLEEGYAILQTASALQCEEAALLLARLGHWNALRHASRTICVFSSSFN